MDPYSVAGDSKLLEVEGCAGGYGSLKVFSNVDLALKQGEAIGITGVNGAGKSTLMKTIAGLLPPQGGVIKLCGVELQSVPAYRRVAAGVVLVPEGRQIIGSLSVEENLDLAENAARGKSRSSSSIDPFGQVYDLFPRLAERAKQKGGSLSGGEQQMLAIGRAMLSRPKVLMLDEPTQGLAPVVVQDVVKALVVLRDMAALVIVEQNRAVLEQVVGRIGVMRNGSVII